MTDPTPGAYDLPKRRPSHDAAQSRPRQLDLIDHGLHSAKTRAVAATAASKTKESRRDRIELYVARCGQRGCTRHEISEALSIPYTSIPSAVLALLASGRIRETERTRLTAFGKPAAVLVSALLRRTHE